MNRDAALAKIRTVWGERSVTEQCFVQLVSRLKPEGVNYLPLHTLLRILSEAGIEAAEARECLMWLSSSALGILRLEYEVMPEGASEFLLRPTQLHAAIASGHLAHPETGKAVEEFSKYTFPVFSASSSFIELLQAERELD